MRHFLPCVVLAAATAGCGASPNPLDPGPRDSIVSATPVAALLQEVIELADADTATPALPSPASVSGLNSARTRYFLFRTEHANAVFAVASALPGNHCIARDSGAYRFLLPVTQTLLDEIDNAPSTAGANLLRGTTDRIITGQGDVVHAEIVRLYHWSGAGRQTLRERTYWNAMKAPGASVDSLVFEYPITADARQRLAVGDLLGVYAFAIGEAVVDDNLCGKQVAGAVAQWRSGTTSTPRITTTP
jgi:hypothetical protein